MTQTNGAVTSNKRDRLAAGAVDEIYAEHPVLGPADTPGSKKAR
jgi:hypothetical protein